MIERRFYIEVTLTEKEHEMLQEMLQTFLNHMVVLTEEDDRYKREVYQMLNLIKRKGGAKELL